MKKHNERQIIPAVKPTVDEVAEELRVKLGLRTWEAQAEHARRMLQAHDFYNGCDTKGRRRRSGRTTRQIVRAIATCLVDGWDAILIDAAQSVDLRRFLRNETLDTLAKLGLEIEVAREARTTRGRAGVVLVDHFYYETRTL